MATMVSKGTPGGILAILERVGAEGAVWGSGQPSFPVTIEGVTVS